MVVKEIKDGLLEEIEMSHFGKEVMILKMVVKEIEDGLLEEMDMSHFGKEQDIDGESEDGNEKKLVMVNEEGCMS
nr:hypothetical protein [Tanacetum cinerariifolium]